MQTGMYVFAGCLFAALLMTETQAFAAGRALWPEGRQSEKNLSVGFRATIERPETVPVTLRVNASTIYRAFVNGRFAGYGPARAAHGYYRVDEWDITPLLSKGPNVVAIEVAGYNVNSYYLLDQPSFLQAEVVTGDRVLAATGDDKNPFEAHILDGRVQKVQRYSFQRPFMEVYRLRPGMDAWRTDPTAKVETVALEDCGEKKLLPRRVAYPTFEVRPAVELVSSGTMEPFTPDSLWKDRSLTNIGPNLGGYPEAELDAVVSDELQRIKTATNAADGRALDGQTPLTLAPMQYRILRLDDRLLCGFPRLSVECTTPTRLLVTFDEMLTGGDVDWRRLGCVNCVSYELAPGKYDLEAFEPTTMKYMKLIALEGQCTVSGVGVRLYENPAGDGAVFETPDERLNLIFQAGRTTFAQNALDVFMDCPSRERAGWLSDSFFAARAEMAACGKPLIEKNFIENFMLPEHFAHLPEGMLPMCYPADHNDGVYIPNWAMWFVVQLEEYLHRSGDRQLVDALKPRVMALHDYFKHYENSDGLLEKLDSWVFVEWSAANDFVQDVNYPTNMLYAGMLDAMGRIYNQPELNENAAAIRQTIRSQALKGLFFSDNAVRDGKGALAVTDNRTETCQYYAFFFGVATPESDPELWRVMMEEFGPKHRGPQDHPEIHKANAFFGDMLRQELLSRDGRVGELCEEAGDYLLPMAEATGTLWEHEQAVASMSHGFEAHIMHVFYRDVLGLYEVDPLKKTITLRFADVDLPWCRGSHPLGEGRIGLEWRREGGKILYRLDAPEGYTVKTINPTGKELVATDFKATGQ